MGVKTLTYVLLGKDQLTPTFKKAGKEAEGASTGIAGSLSNVGLAGVAVAGVIGGVMVKALKDARAEGWGPLKVAAKNAGISFDQFKPKAEEAGRTMASLGFSQADVNKSLKSLLTTTRSGPQSLNALGTAADFAKFKGIGLSDASNVLAKAAVGSTKALKEVGISTADLPKHFSSTGTAASRMQIVMDLLNKRVGGSAAAAANTFGGKLAVMHAQIENVSAKIGSALLPILSSLLSMVSKYVLPAVQQFGDWFEKVGAPAIKSFADKLTPLVTVVLKGLFKAIQDIVSVFQGLPAPVKDAAKSLLMVAVGALAIGKGIAVVKDMSAAVKAFGIASKLAALGNPWILLAVAIAVVAVLIITHWKTVSRVTVEIFNHILNVIKGVWNWIKSNWPLLLVILTGPFGLAVVFIVKHWDIIVNACKVALDSIKKAATIAWNAVANTFKWAWEHILKPAIQVLWTTFSTVFGFIVKGAATAFGWIPGIGGKLKGASKAFDAFKDDVNKALGGLNDKTVSVSVAMKASTNPYPGGISGRKATGGRIFGSGTGTSDTAGLFALSHGEWVVKESSASKYGPTAMDAVNRGTAVIGYASGGGVGVTTSFPANSLMDSFLMAHMTKLVQSSWQSILSVPAGGGGGGSGNFGSGVQRWAPLVLQILAMYGQPASLLGTVLRRMNQESGGNPRAINLWDSNAMAGHPSMGLMQTIIGTFLAFAGPYASRGPYDPFANIYASFGYAIRQYGSLSAAFNRAGGYASGTKSARRGWAWVGERGAELVNFGGGESITPHGGGNIIWTGDVVIRGHALATKQEIGALVSDALTEFERKGGRTR